MAGNKQLLIMGDSQLIISCLLGVFRAKAPYLYRVINSCKKMIKEMGLVVQARHVPRAENVVADWLA